VGALNPPPAVRRCRAAVAHGDGRFTLETIGVHALAFAPLALVRHGGQALQLSGAHGVQPASMLDFWWDKRYLVPLYGGCHPGRDLPRLAGWAREGRLDLQGLITREFRLGELHDALDDLLAGRIVKAVMRLDADDDEEPPP
jgi:S-(hydroxymethyl)glutathione dehydrogenase/alcohol dehydrogenase